MESNFILSIIFSVLGFLVSVFALIFSLFSFNKNCKFNKLKNFQEVNNIFFENNKNHIEKIQSFKEISILNLKEIRNKYLDMKESQIYLLTFLDSYLINNNNKNYKNIFYCQWCSNFYSSNSLKIIRFLIRSSFYGKAILNILISTLLDQNLSKRNDENIEKLNTCFNFLTQSVILKITLLYSKKSFLGLVDFTEFNELKTFLKKTENSKLEKISAVNAKILELINLMENNHFKKEIEKKLEQNELIKQSIKNKHHIFNEEYEALLIRLHFFFENQPLVSKEIIKFRKKIIFCLSRCHYCLFQYINIGKTDSFEQLYQYILKHF